MRSRPGGAARTRVERLGVALTAAALAAAPIAAIDPLPDFAWSPDGTALVAVEREAGVAVTVRVVDGSTGAVRGELAAAAWKAALGDAAAGRDLRALPAPRGERVLLRSPGRAALWTTAGGEVATLDVGDLGDATSFSPDGDRLAFVRDGELWTLALGDRGTSRLASGVVSEPPPAWSPDGRSLAYALRGDDGALGLAIVDVVDPYPRPLETAEAGEPIGLRWRFDLGAVGVVLRRADPERLEVALCHPLRGHCRTLAERSWPSARESVDELRFLADGFLWGTESGGLAFFDTLGRQRRSLLAENRRLLGIAAVLEPSHEVAVVAEERGESGFARLLLVDLRTGASTEIASAPGWPPVEISERLRSWLRPRKPAPDAAFDGYLLERIDGTRVRAFGLDGAPEAP